MRNSWFIAPVAFAFTVCAALTIAAAGETDGYSQSAQIAQSIITIIALVSLIVGVILGLINRQSYDRLKATIADLESVSDSKDHRFEEQRLHFEAKVADLRLEIEHLKQEVQTLHVNNRAVVGQNLQMKAILKHLRMTGKWEGHEDAIFDSEPK